VEAVIAHFKVLSTYLPRRAKENIKLNSGKSVSWLIFEWVPPEYDSEMQCGSP